MGLAKYQRRRSTKKTAFKKSGEEEIINCFKLYGRMLVLFGDGHLFFNWAEVATLRSNGELLLGFYLSGDSSECAVRTRGKAEIFYKLLRCFGCKGYNVNLIGATDNTKNAISLC
jgi:hypothetical protein